MMIQTGDILIFKGKGLVYEVLSRLIKLFDPTWDRWGWHTGFVVDDKVTTCEALAKGVCLNTYPISYFTPDNVRVYRVFDNPPSKQKIDAFLTKHLGEKYDILVYPLTALAYIVRHYWHRKIPRLFDNSWSCWELTYYFADDMGHPIAEDYDFPMINEMSKALATYLLSCQPIA